MTLPDILAFAWKWLTTRSQTTTEATSTAVNTTSVGDTAQHQNVNVGGSQVENAGCQYHGHNRDRVSFTLDKQGNVAQILCCCNTDGICKSVYNEGKKCWLEDRKRKTAPPPIASSPNLQREMLRRGKKWMDI